MRRVWRLPPQAVAAAYVLSCPPPRVFARGRSPPPEPPPSSTLASIRAAARQPDMPQPAAHQRFVARLGIGYAPKLHVPSHMDVVRPRQPLLVRHGHAQFVTEKS